MSTEGNETVTRAGSVLQTPVDELIPSNKPLARGTPALGSGRVAGGCASGCAEAGGCGRVAVLGGGGGQRNVLWQGGCGRRLRRRAVEAAERRWSGRDGFSGEQR